jgi:hypothetical protein
MPFKVVMCTGIIACSCSWLTSEAGADGRDLLLESGNSSGKLNGERINVHTGKGPQLSICWGQAA